MEMFEVGGCVRDEILGLPSKDIDFSVVLSEGDIGKRGPFQSMVDALKFKGFRIFLMSPQYLTVRAQFPKPQSLVAIKHERAGMTADFVLARKESDYTDGRRPDKVEVGTLEDDLNRRDFTMNAIAKDAEGNFIDPHNGRHDIECKIIRAVGDPFDRLNEDALRAVRAMRFHVTKGFMIEPGLVFAMQSRAVLDAIENKISDERIKDELSKMLHFSTMKSLHAFQRFPALTAAMFSGSVNLDATMKQKGFK